MSEDLKQNGEVEINQPITAAEFAKSIEDYWKDFETVIDKWLESIRDQFINGKREFELRGTYDTKEKVDRLQTSLTKRGFKVNLCTRLIGNKIVGVRLELP